MMKFKFQIYLIIMLLSIITIAFRIDTIIYGFEFIFSFIISFFYMGTEIFLVFDFLLADILISTILIILLPIFCFVKRNKIKLLQKESSILSIFLILTIFSFLFAPLVTNKNPNFKKDLSVTKLLSPFSRVEILHLRNNEEFAADGKLWNLKRLKNKIVRKEFNENIIIADSIKNGRTVIYFQKDKPHKIDPSLCLQEENKVKISSAIFLFGSDELGRDIFTRIIYGTRISLLVGIGSLIIILSLGVGLGFLSGLKGGLLNVILSRITDMFLYIPNIFLVILILALFGDSLQTVIIVLGLSGWMSLFKIVKSEVVALKNKDFIISSRKIGLSDKRLLYYEVLPVIAPPVIFTLISMFANIILAESSLSFLGLGGAGEYPSWGSMIHSGQEYLTHAWWMLIFPGSILVALLFSIHELGQKVRIRLNPRMQKYDK